MFWKKHYNLSGIKLANLEYKEYQRCVREIQKRLVEAGAYTMYKQTASAEIARDYFKKTLMRAKDEVYATVDTRVNLETIKWRVEQWFKV